MLQFYNYISECIMPVFRAKAIFDIWIFLYAEESGAKLAGWNFQRHHRICAKRCSLSQRTTLYLHHVY